MNGFEIYITPAARARLPRVRVLGLILHITRRPDRQPDPVTKEWEALGRRWAGRDRATVDTDPSIRAYLAAYAGAGLDPKRYPPSPAALIKRFLLNSCTPPRINAVVDALNVTSVEQLVPMGAFDAERIEGPVRLDSAVGTELFTPVNSPDVLTLQAGTLILADDARPLNIFCTRAHDYQKITERTHEVLLLAEEVPGVDTLVVQRALLRVVDLLARSYDVSSGTRPEWASPVKFQDAGRPPTVQAVKEEA